MDGSIMFTHYHPALVATGRKTQTRRVIKEKQPSGHHYIQRMWGRSPPPNPVDFGTPGLFCEVGPDYPDGEEDLFKCPYGKPGDRLWVKEAWGIDLGHGGWATGDATLTYRCDGKQVPLLKSKFDLPETVGKLANFRAAWRSPRFMPRWASRSTIELLDVRAERLQDISPADCVAEGIEGPGPGVVIYGLPENDQHVGKPGYSTGGPTPLGTFATARAAYALVWQTINGIDSWQPNPWVWALTFRKVES